MGWGLKPWPFSLVHKGFGESDVFKARSFALKITFFRRSRGRTAVGACKRVINDKTRTPPNKKAIQKQHQVGKTHHGPEEDQGTKSQKQKKRSFKKRDPVPLRGNHKAIGEAMKEASKRGVPRKAPAALPAPVWGRWVSVSSGFYGVCGGLKGKITYDVELILDLGFPNKKGLKEPTSQVKG